MKPKFTKQEKVEISADTFEMVASYADGSHYVETGDSLLDAILSAKEHLKQEGCDYVRIMRKREYPPNTTA